MYIDKAKRVQNKTNTKLNNMASASHEKNKKMHRKIASGQAHERLFQKSVQYCKLPTQMKEGGMDYLF